MKIICKLAWKNLTANRKRMLFTLLCVILSVSMIGVVLGISDSILQNADYGGDVDNERAAIAICVGFVAVSCFMSCFSICTAFSISIRDRIKSYGFLTSVGMSQGQKSALVMMEAAIYGVIGVLLGTLLGFGLAAWFYGGISELLLTEENISIGRFVLSGGSVALSLLLGLVTVLIASFFPLLKMRKLSVTETVKDGNQINISLKQSLLSKAAEKLFGRLGLLAGQNYDNNKVKYRALSLTLSGGATFFITVYSFFRYPIWYELQSNDHVSSFFDIWYQLSNASSVLMGFFVLVFLICSMGSYRQNMEQRKKEFAMYKSMGMQNSELQKIMSIESVFFTWYAILFGFIGSLIGNYALCTFFRITGVEDLKFHFPIEIFGAFVLFDLAVGSLFALYSGIKVSKVNIIETIRNN